MTTEETPMEFCINCGETPCAQRGCRRIDARPQLTEEEWVAYEAEVMTPTDPGQAQAEAAEAELRHHEQARADFARDAYARYLDSRAWWWRG